tara:strand:- start:231 stop:470 length:240 start_codon:yes stop_codon:yes gene_type:complete
MGELVDLQEYKNKKDEEEVKRLRKYLDQLKQELEYELSQFTDEVYSNLDIFEPKFMMMVSPLLLDALGDGEEFISDGEE